MIICMGAEQAHRPLNILTRYGLIKEQPIPLLDERIDLRLVQRTG